MKGQLADEHDWVTHRSHIGLLRLTGYFKKHSPGEIKIVFLIMKIFKNHKNTKKKSPKINN